MQDGQDRCAKSNSSPSGQLHPGGQLNRPPLLAEFSEKIQALANQVSAQNERIYSVTENLGGEIPQQDSSAEVSKVSGCRVNGQLGQVHDSLRILEEDVINLRVRVDELTQCL